MEHHLAREGEEREDGVCYHKVLDQQTAKIDRIYSFIALKLLGEFCANIAESILLVAI